MSKKRDRDVDRKSAAPQSKTRHLDLAEAESERMLIDAKRLRNDAEAMRRRAEAAVNRSRNTQG